ENPASYRVVRTKSYLFNKAPRIQTWLKTTDDPLVKDVLVPVSAE
ncbi:hypothetical protein, partial [Klebsiella pneumoniae]